ncbi:MULTISPECIES: hypothetical protein [Vibrio]|uniref:Uncharacterized protein n=2 Tax=Vibrio TaxID=662 RepID=A0ABP1WXY5_9VIBR|nr:MULTISPECIES: hypothetical protein [Vibrio]PMI17926.1 hypothetical protein BCU50_21740 [Vibrio sp. 10N.286.46.E10]TCL30676.1 hypothetical protein EDB52_101963 [Vibrio crassostreae]TCN96317.1 hypothetical protein EDB51_115103 [Vibrio crassostreae]TCT53237.1 hypothetical protein EDB39_101303 [Vibrio crassostreae]TCT64115.1 hypothetical protein EDB40_101615 [Vibrio crassostreae]
METVVYQLTGNDLDALIEALIITMVVFSLFGRVCSFVIDWIDRLLLTRTIRDLEVKRDFLLSEIGSLNRQKSASSKA